MSYQFIRPGSPVLDKLQQHRHEGVLTDITIQVGDRKFPAHRLVLHDVTPFLKGLLAEHFPVDDHVYQIDEEFFEAGLMEPILTYFYTGRITLTPDNAHALCIAAHFLQADELVAACEKYLSCKVNESNVLDLIILADRLELNNLLDRCARPLSRISRMGHYSQELMNLSKESIERLASKLAEKSPDKGTFLINRWILYNRHEPRPSLPVPVPRPRNHSTDYLFCIGGSPGINCNKLKHLLTVSRFNSDTDQWSSMEPMSRKRYNFAGAVYGTKIYICGGFLKDNKKSLAVYDCLKDTWDEDLPEMPFIPGSELTAVATIRQRIYFNGGYFSDDDGDDKNEEEPAFEYNPQNGKWKPMEKMLVRRWGHRMVALGDYLYAIGGNNAGKTAERFTPVIQKKRYSSNQGVWELIASTNYHHEEHTVAVHEGKIYVYSRNGFEVYDPETRTWEVLSKADTDSDFGATLASVDGQLLLIGGANKPYLVYKYCKPACRDVYAYDAYADQWSSFSSMPVSRTQHCSFVVSF